MACLSDKTFIQKDVWVKDVPQPHTWVPRLDCCLAGLHASVLEMEALAMAGATAMDHGRGHRRGHNPCHGGSHGDPTAMSMTRSVALAFGTGVATAMVIPMAARPFP